ncbi:MAG: hypothetical protein L3K04_00745 [Thermoplasmata archaeon]|nr:hypothetical protein [Thermoplasmata archaeon]MCI4340856.1 hypothetical protein [Thermoplasmata archaeon]
MELRSFRTNLSLLRQGVVIGWAFGGRSLAGLVRTAELLQSNMLEPGSFFAAPDGLRFQIRNPPLRVGAFRSLAARVDGRTLPPDHAFIDVGCSGPERSFASVVAGAPVALPMGIRHGLRLCAVTPFGPGEHTVRLELRSVAIPLTSWLEFTERFERPA